jgi:uncharacterized protein with FMN-binding domain
MLSGRFSFVARRVLTVLACSVVLSVPTVNAWATAWHKATRQRAATVTKTVKGPTVPCPVKSTGHVPSGRWGPLEIAVKISKVPGSTKFKILAVTWPIWPQHTAKSVFINEKALPLLQMQVLQLQSAKIETISGATNVSDSFIQSLHGALLAAAKA